MTASSGGRWGTCRRLRIAPECRFLAPGAIEILDTLFGRRHLGDIDRLFTCDYQKGLEHRRIVALPGDQSSGNHLQNVGAVDEHVAGLGQLATTEILEDHRQVIWQLVSDEIKAGRTVELFELDHCRPPVAALSMQMLEQMQRQGSATVEQLAIPLLGIKQVTFAEGCDECQEARALRRRDERRPLD